MNETVNVFRVIKILVACMMAFALFTYVDIAANQKDTIEIQRQCIDDLKQHIEWQDSIIRVYDNQIMNLQYVRKLEE